MKNKDAECLKTVAGIKELMLSVSGFRGCFKNTLYPKQVKVKTVDDFVEAIKFDHLCGKFKDGKRGKEFFLSSDVLCLDVDNDHSDDKEDWITPETVAEGFPNVSMIIVPSIHNNKEKKGKSSRPRFHVYMQIPELTDAKEYVALKRRIFEEFPFFDTQALDAARVIRGGCYISG